MLFNALNLIFLNVTMLNCTKKIFTQISLAGLYSTTSTRRAACKLQVTLRACVHSACETGIRIQVFEAVNDQYVYSSHFVIFDGLNLFRILPVRNDQ